MLHSNLNQINEMFKIDLTEHKETPLKTTNLQFLQFLLKNVTFYFEN